MKHKTILKYNLLQAFQLITKVLQTQPEYVWLINNRGVKEKFKAIPEKLIELSELVFYKGKARTGFMCETSLKSLSEVSAAGD